MFVDLPAVAESTIAAKHTVFIVRLLHKVHTRAR